MPHAGKADYLIGVTSMTMDNISVGDNTLFAQPCLDCFRLNKAKEKLRSDKKRKLSMDEVAASCGFSSANYFSLMFKRYIGTAPTTYRKHETNK